MAKKSKSYYNDSLPSLFDDMGASRQPEPRTANGPRRSRVVMTGGSAPFHTSTGAESIDPVKIAPTDAWLRFMSFGSGSSGNCAYVGNDREGLLIDAGVDLKRVSEGLARNGVAWESIGGIVLTHDHSDHVRYAYTILRSYRHMRLYCTPKVLNGILRRHSISHRIKDYHQPIYKEIPFLIGRIKLTAFEVSHDGTDNAGFFIEYGKHRFAAATDLGIVGERAQHYLSQAHYLMIESNYDVEMLMRGPYPEYLKARIITDRGHLDNVDCAAFVAQLAKSSPDLRYVFLCHLSNENNTPQIAESTVRRAIEEAGVSVGDCSDSLATRDCRIQLMPLPRFDATRMFIFR